MASGQRGLKALAATSYATATIKADRSQHSFKLSLEQFMQKRGAAAIIARGKKMKAANAALFAKLEKRFGVPPGPLIAIWGMETAFGAYMGNQNTISAVATLAYDCRRPEFFTEQLIAALKLVDKGVLSASSQRRHAWRSGADAIPAEECVPVRCRWRWRRHQPQQQGGCTGLDRQVPQPRGLARMAGLIAPARLPTGMPRPSIRKHLPSWPARSTAAADGAPGNSTTRSTSRCGGASPSSSSLPCGWVSNSTWAAAVSGWRWPAARSPMRSMHSSSPGRRTSHHRMALIRRPDFTVVQGMEGKPHGIPSTGPLGPQGVAAFAGHDEFRRPRGSSASSAACASKDAARLVDVALDHGVNLLDTSNAYTTGKSEEAVGEILKGRSDQILVGTESALRHGAGTKRARPVALSHHPCNARPA